jgi:pyruvate,water dikinase
MPAWTPLFAPAAAIVTETGGVLSHAAVTAREYATPAVLNVPDATRKIRDGQIVEVDGSQGIVRILS